MAIVKGTIYISDSGCDAEMRISKEIIEDLESSSPNIKMLYGPRDFISGGLEIDNKRNTTRMADMVVILLSDRFIDREECMYDVGLAIVTERKLVIIDKTKSYKIPPFMHGHTKIKGRKKITHILPKLKRVIDRFFASGSSVEHAELRLRKDQAHALVRKYEQTANSDDAATLSEEIRSLRRHLKQTLTDRKIEKRIASKEVELATERYEQELRKRYQLEKENNDLIQKLRRLRNSPEAETDEQDPYTTLKTMQDLIYQILIQISTIDKSGNKENIDDLTETRIPSELRCFCQKYEKMIGENIRRFAQLLGLTDVQMEKVEEYRKYGYVEMFWQTIRKWKPKSNDRGSLMRLINALEDIGVDIEGKPLSSIEEKVLHEKLPFILKNCYRFGELIPYLMSHHLLTDITKNYITEPMFDDERILRLVNVLSTKENGLRALCDAFKNTNQEFIADEILNALPIEIQGISAAPREVSDESSGSTFSLYTSDDTDIQVAIVSPIQVSVKPKQSQEKLPRLPSEDSWLNSTDSEKVVKNYTEFSDVTEKTVKCYTTCSIQ